MRENKLVSVSIIFIAVVLLALVLKVLVFIRPFVIAIVLTFLFMPIIRFSERKKVPFTLALFLVLVILVVSVSLVGYVVLDERDKLEGDFPQEHMQWIDKTISNVENAISIAEDYGIEIDVKKLVNPERIGEIVTLVFSTLIQTIGSLFSELFYVILFTMFLIPSHRLMIRNMEQGMKKVDIKKFKSILIHIEKSILSYLGAKSMISAGTALISGIILFAFGSSFVIIFSALIFILNFIPNIGSFIAVLIALIGYLVKFGPNTTVIWLGLLLIAVQILFGNILEPKFFGDKLKLSPIVILLSLFTWFWIWGIIGMILAVPMTSIIKIIFDHFESTKKIARAMS